MPQYNISRERIPFTRNSLDTVNAVSSKTRYNIFFVEITTDTKKEEPLNSMELVSKSL